MELKPLSDVMGAEVLGLDLQQPLESGEFERVLEWFWQYRVLVFRDQDLSHQQQLAFCGRFGGIEPAPPYMNASKSQLLTVISNVGPDGEPFPAGPPIPWWHSDLCYTKRPAKCTFLYAALAPELGGQTLFADMVRAYAALPEPLRLAIDGREAVFGAGLGMKARCAAAGYEPRLDPARIPPEVSHPVVRVHPVTGEKAVFVNWVHTERIEGLSEEEGASLLAAVYAHCMREEQVYRHTYRQGDLIVWDNAAVIHSPTHTASPRIMHRVVIAGEGRA